MRRMRKWMQVLVRGWIGLGLIASAALAQTQAQPAPAGKPGVVVVEVAEIKAKVDAVDYGKRLVTLTGPAGNTVTVKAGPEVKNLDLWNMPEDSLGTAALDRAAAEAGWAIRRVQLKPSPRVSLEGGWEAYLARLDRKQRHELRRKMRRVAEHPQGTTITRASAGARLPQSVEAFLDLMNLDGAKAGFLTPPMRRMFHSVASAAAAGGWLRLEFLNVGETPAAGAFCFDYADRLWVFNSGLDPRYRSLSPGWALMGHLIRSAAEEGKVEVDFLRGDEDYKYRLGGVARFVERITLTRP